MLNKNILGETNSDLINLVPAAASILSVLISNPSFASLIPKVKFFVIWTQNRNSLKSKE